MYTTVPSFNTLIDGIVKQRFQYKTDTIIKRHFLYNCIIFNDKLRDRIENHF